MYFNYTALHAIKEGCDVYGLMDAAGDSTINALNTELRGCYKQVIPITIVSLVLNARLGQS